MRIHSLVWHGIYFLEKNKTKDFHHGIFLLIQMSVEITQSGSPINQWLYSYNKITTTQIQISRQNWNGFFSNISNQMTIWLTPIVSRAKHKWFKSKKVKKLALSSQLLSVQILTKYVQVLILCLSYFITTVEEMIVQSFKRKEIDCMKIYLFLWVS